MQMTVIASGSSGNCYVLEGRRSALILECGVPPEKMMAGTVLEVSKVAACLVTHEHGDHAAFAARYAALGIPVAATPGTLRELAINGPQYALYYNYTYALGEFAVQPIPTNHDAAEPCAYLIRHHELGTLLFVTDTAPLPYDFRKLALDHIMVEANYDPRMMDENVTKGIVNAAQAVRTRKAHLSLRDAIELVSKCETAALKTVTLIHLSAYNSDAAAFQSKMEGTVIFASVWVARPHLTIEMNSTFDIA